MFFNKSRPVKISGFLLAVLRPFAAEIFLGNAKVIDWRSAGFEKAMFQKRLNKSVNR